MWQPGGRELNPFSTASIIWLRERPRNCRKQTVKAKIRTVSADEIQDEAALFAFVKAQAASNLLLKEHRALRGTQQKQRVNRRQVNALIVKIAGHKRAQFAPRQTLLVLGGEHRSPSHPLRRAQATQLG